MFSNTYWHYAEVPILLQIFFNTDSVELVSKPTGLTYATVLSAKKDTSLKRAAHVLKWAAHVLKRAV